VVATSARFSSWLAKKESKPLSYKKLGWIHKKRKVCSFEQRIQILGLKPDRADAIVPACQIHLDVMRWCGIEQIFVPQVGQRDLVGSPPQGVKADAAKRNRQVYPIFQESNARGAIPF